MALYSQANIFAAAARYSAYLQAQKAESEAFKTSLEAGLQDGNTPEASKKIALEAAKAAFDKANKFSDSSLWLGFYEPGFEVEEACEVFKSEEFRLRAKYRNEVRAYQAHQRALAASLT